MTGLCRPQGYLKSIGEFLLGCMLMFAVPCVSSVAQSQGQTATATGSGARSASAPAVAGTPFTQEKLSTLLPATVYFGGQSAPIQLRNAAGVQFGNGSILWMALVDSSGYSTAVQQKYQFYLVTEGNVRIGNVELRPGAYGGGFLGERFVLLDLGNHAVGEGATQLDAAMRRPRPLQLFPDRSDAVKLYLGRRWVSIQTAAP